MKSTITIEPVTRIEGHAKITLQLDDAGRVADAMFHITQFRGFEKFVEGRPMTEIPSLMARICGICPVSHLLASAKACDDLLTVDIPGPAVKLRRLINLAQLVQSHALSFFHLSSPDLLLGMDSDPAARNVFGLIQHHPQQARDGIMLRKFGQQIIQWLAGKRVHPSWIVPGGVNHPLNTETRDTIRNTIPEALTMARRTLETFRRIVDRFEEEIQTFGNFPSLFAGLSGEDNQWEHYEGSLRFVDSEGTVLADEPDRRAYAQHIAEASENFSYLKSPYYKPLGYPGGMYRVGPLARVNMCSRFGTPLADEELAIFRQRAGRMPSSSFHYHWTRLIELLHGVERIAQLIDEPDITDSFVRARARPNRRDGVGISEAPRGTLIHHYRIDEHGRMTWANLIIATGHNNLAMNRSVLQVAQRFVKGDKLHEGMLNRVEAVIRCFDPCLSCSTHALGQMPLMIQLHDATGKVVDELQRRTS